MKTRRIVIAGAGFAGVFAALAAAGRLRSELEMGAVMVELINPDAYLTIRPRLYEAELDSARIPLRSLTEPVGVGVRLGVIEHIDTSEQLIRLRSSDGQAQIAAYDILILATGSSTAPPAAWSGVHDVDSWAGARRLHDRIDELASTPGSPARPIVVIGAGFTGLEVATEIASRLDYVRRGAGKPRVILLERSADVAPDFGPDARAFIESALARLRVERFTNIEVTNILGGETLVFNTGPSLRADLVVWTGGPRASRLGRESTIPVDELGRVRVDRHLRVVGARNVFAAGDIAAAAIAGKRTAPMSCQHAMPQGRIAGHNAAGAILGDDPIEYDQQLYVTCLDLGSAGALLTAGFERSNVVASGAAAKAVKRLINRAAIYPPVDGKPLSLYAAGRPAPAPLALTAADHERWAVALIRLGADGTTPDRAAQVLADGFRCGARA